MTHYLLLGLGIVLGVVGQFLLKSGSDAGGIVDLVAPMVQCIPGGLAVDRGDEHAEPAVAPEAVLEDLGGGDAARRILAMKADVPDQLLHHRDHGRDVAPAHGADGDAAHVTRKRGRRLR